MSARGRRRRFRGSDRGSATVWSLGGMAVMCVVFGVVLALGQAVVARHRAAGGADLAALAAADHWAEGGAGACARAERVARAQGVRIVRCAIVGETSDVTASAGGGPFAAEVRSRAGPAGPVATPLPSPPPAVPVPYLPPAAPASARTPAPWASVPPVPAPVP
ncbi:Rv3654c family TadE-like protein [Streptomyces sp. NPDC091219]|uniref:Rv3654c family TadE-like protein n=1 Tax=Streptomyces sp. NPDC091219 TaxID=3155193 RepID=UPI00344B6441